MALQITEIEDKEKYRQILHISYNDLLPFILDTLKQRTVLIILYWSICIIFLGQSITIINLSEYYPARNILLHTILGLLIMPLLVIPAHELLHILPYYLSGARNIRVGMDLKQYLFYVTAHRYVASPTQFRIVAIMPFLVISIVSIILIIMLPGVWKWSLSLFLFVHTTMCAGDVAMLNFYYINRHKKIYTWDDADKKMAYFYEKI